MTPTTPSLLTRLGIQHPIIQAPVGGCSTPELVAAVANAGGLGMLSITWRPLDHLSALLAATHALTSRPFGVNLVLTEDQQARLSLSLAAGVRLVSFFWGDPAPYVPAVHAAGGMVFHTVGSVAEAEQAVAAGVDVIVAQGWEAGGHVRGEVSTLALVPAVARAVAPVPVVAAGGIADGRGVAAALALGASAAWIGTRFLAAAEASLHPAYQAALLAAGETDTRHSLLFDGGWPAAAHRTLRNNTFAAWEAAGRPAPGGRPGEGEIVGWNELGEPVARYDSTAPVEGATGDVTAMALYAGQGVGLIRQPQPAADIVAALVTEARAALASASAGLGAAPG